jgi:N-glycosylase/DNA lyase
MMARARFELAVAPPFELPLAVTGHGWYDLAPHRYETGAARFETVVANGDVAWDVAVEQKDAKRGATLHVTIDGAGAPSAAARAAVRAALRRILRLDHDFAPFWKRCSEWPSVSWAAKRGGGRLLASATLFEDLLKLLFTTNCSWAATRLMAQRLCDALGPKAPSGRAAFPSAAACAATSEKFWRETVRAGYRARGARALARRFAGTGGAAGAAESEFIDCDVTTDELRERLLALDGFGPYAAGQALRLLGRHDDLALDSWCRAQLAKQLGKKRPPSDRTIERRYARYGADRGLVLWLELTASWHGEAGDAANWLADHGGR